MFSDFQKVKEGPLNHRTAETALRERNGGVMSRPHLRKNGFSPFRCRTIFPESKPRPGFHKGTCWACQRECRQSFHHLLPKRLRLGGKVTLVPLCADCHLEAERLITEAENEILRQHLDLYREAMVELQCRVRDHDYLVTLHR